MNRFPRYRLPHSLHTPFLHFDLITRPPPLLPFFLSFSSFFPPIPPTILLLPFARFLTPSIRDLPTLSAGKTEKRDELRELLVRSSREKAPSLSPSELRETWETRFSFVRVALLTHRIYTIKSFALLHLVFPGRNSIVSLSEGTSLSKGKGGSLVLFEGGGNSS